VGQVGAGAPGIFEFRVRHDAVTILRERGLPVPEHLRETSTDVLLRVFCHAHGKKVVLLLAGYDKGKEPSVKRQNAEIKRARQRLTRWRLSSGLAPSGRAARASLAASGGLDRICGMLHKYCWTTPLLEFRDGHEVRRLHQRG